MGLARVSRIILLGAKEGRRYEGGFDFQIKRPRPKRQLPLKQRTCPPLS